MSIPALARAVLKDVVSAMISAESSGFGSELSI
jgi:hypothetical protein